MPRRINDDDDLEEVCKECYIQKRKIEGMVANNGGAIQPVTKDLATKKKGHQKNDSEVDVSVELFV